MRLQINFATKKAIEDFVNKCVDLKILVPKYNLELLQLGDDLVVIKNVKE